MLYLVLVSFIWAFSPGLIKGRLVGVDPTAVGVIRLALALVVFLPFFRPRGLRRATVLRLAIIGAVQFGLMYLMYLSAFTYLPAYAIGLFTITTPLYLVVIDAIACRRWQPSYTLAALLAIAGAAVMVAKGGDLGSAWLRGFLLVQLSNLCFAAGQVAWRRERAQVPTTTSDAALFALPYLGAFLITALVSTITTDWNALHFTPSQLITLIYLGAIASGVAFFLWNFGASRVGTGTLAVLNNLKVPLTVTCSLLFFGEQADLTRLACSFACFGLALIVAGRTTP
ncbi:MAG: EamA family transporter [Opitutaceae bacterium]|nr:EamA family transporter [Opitutaceae bacterium]